MGLNNIKINNTTNVKTGVVYDISKTTGQSYDTLADALGTDGNNVPSEVREGGMSVRFLHTGDKYVQYRLMTLDFSTTESDWQGVDEEPTAGSDNLVKSGGVAKELYIIEDNIPYTLRSSNNEQLDENGKITTTIQKNRRITEPIAAKSCLCTVSNIIGRGTVYFYNENINLETGAGFISNIEAPIDNEYIVAPEGAVWMVISFIQDIVHPGITILKKLSKISTEIENLKEKIDDNEVITGELTYTELSVFQGKQFDNDGKLVVPSYTKNRRVAEIPVQECIVDISSTAGSRPSICFYDSTMNLNTGQGLLEKIVLSENFTYNLHITPPAGAVHMIAAYMKDTTSYFGLSVRGIAVMNNNDIMQEVYRLINIKNIYDCYVSPDGSDGNDGTANSPFLTFQYAIPGKYEHQKINISKKVGVSIKCIEGNYPHRSSYLESHLRQGRIILDNSVDIDSVELDSSTGLYTFSNSFSENSNWYKVFITKELPIVRTGLRSQSYWAILWEIGESIAEHKKLIPVLSISDCQNTNSSFYYNGTTVYIHPNGQDISKLSFKYLYDENDFTTIDISNSKDITIEGFDIYFGTQELIGSDHSTNVVIKNCDLGFSAYSGGQYPNSTDSNVYNCNAFCVCADGFAPTGYGVCNYYNCNGYYNGDDGISHHDGSMGIIDGGRWEHNHKGGVAPSHGSNVNVQNVCSRYNGYGIYLISDESRRTNATVLVKNNTFTNNTTDMGFVRYNAIVTGCIYSTKDVGTGAEITEISNIILT